MTNSVTSPQWSILTGDAREQVKTLGPDSVDCVVTSPPYFGLRAYKAGPAEVGRERTIEAYLDSLLAVFRECRRVMKDSACLWVNIADSYAGNRGYQVDGTKQCRGSQPDSSSRVPPGLKPGDLCGVPWRFALAMQADGWFLRDAVIWAKAVSFAPDGISGSTMPESVDGWKWTRCRVKVKKTERASNEFQQNTGGQSATLASRAQREAYLDKGGAASSWRDCPGCARCIPTGGYVLRRSAWRSTKSHEFIFMFSKTADYYGDREAVKEAAIKGASGSRFDHGVTGARDGGDRTQPGYRDSCGRNPRNVWWLQPGGNGDVAGKHFAMFPPELPERCIRATTPEVGCCPKCGAAWVRVTGKGERRVTDAMRVAGCDSAGKYHGTARGDYKSGEAQDPSESKRRMLESMSVPSVTLGWRLSCACWRPGDVTAPDWLALVPESHKPVPAFVLDPFSGMATTGIAALKLGRRYLGVELNPEYAERARARLRDFQGVFAAPEQPRRMAAREAVACL